MFSKIHWKYIVAGMVSGLVVVSAAYLFYLAATDYDSLSQYGLYKLFKDHGSFIGAIMAIFGVAWIVSNQNETTQKMIESNYEIMKEELWENKRQKKREYFVRIECAVTESFYSSASEHAQMIFENKIHIEHLSFIKNDIKDLNMLLANPEAVKLLLTIQKYVDACLLYGQTMGRREFIDCIHVLNNQLNFAPDYWKDKIFGEIMRNEETGDEYVKEGDLTFLKNYKKYIRDFVLPSLRECIEKRT